MTKLRIRLNFEKAQFFSIFYFSINYNTFIDIFNEVLSYFVIYQYEVKINLKTEKKFFSLIRLFNILHILRS
jgi:hypothetical protein